VASYGPHFGEEAPLVGRGGSGTIFFGGCNLACVFCQNHEISQPDGDRGLAIGVDGSPRGGAPGRAGAGGPAGAGKAAAKGDGLRPAWEQPSEVIARMMLDLQDLGCENINFVSPSHVVPQILAALVQAVDGDLHLPLVYNSGGYDALQTLRLLDGVVDIYMPDMKYADDEVGARLSGVPDYARRNRAAVLEMHRQVGDLQIDESGVARRGLLVRHLILPEEQTGTADVCRFLAAEVSGDTYINVMEQYRPAHKVARHPSRFEEIARRPSIAECSSAAAKALAAGLWRLDGLDRDERVPYLRPLGEEREP
jgi:putative pyruvate formate lyase activating enzyme